MSLLAILILGWCSSTTPDVSILDCASSANTTECVVGVVDMIKDEFVKNCVQNNVLSKTWLALTIESWALLSPGEVKDIDNLAKECISYSVANPWASPTSTPMFNSFLMWAGGAFLWTYLASSFLGGGRYNYNAPIDNRTRSAYMQDYRKEEEKRRKWWSYVPVRTFNWVRSIGSSYSSRWSVSKWSLWGSAKSWSSVSAWWSTAG